MRNPPFIVRKGFFKVFINGRSIRTDREFVVVYPQGGIPFIFDSLSNSPKIDLRNARYSVISRYTTDKILLKTVIDAGPFSGAELNIYISTSIDDEQEYINAETEIIEALNQAVSKILKHFAKGTNIPEHRSIKQFNIELSDELKNLRGITIESLKASIVDRRHVATREYHDSLTTRQAVPESQKLDPVQASVQNGSVDLTAVAVESEQNTLCSVFANPVVSTGATVLIQVFLHEKSQLLIAAREAQHLDPQSQRRAFKPLGIRLKHRQRVSFYFDSQELIAKGTTLSVTWCGRPVSVVFQAQIPNNARGETVKGCIYPSVDDVPIGEIEFELFLEHSKSQPAESAGSLQRVFDAPKSVGNAARHYKKAFLSYSRKDIAPASVFAEGLTSNDIELFFDLMTMEPGDEWEPKLFQAIEGSDVFFLLWSHNAAESEWVAKECRAACDRHAETYGVQPSIRPIVLDEGAPIPPYCISKFHCDSRWRQIRIAGKKTIFKRPETALVDHN